jgi:uncharacterized coiled-coil DUF342 family protein
MTKEFLDAYDAMLADRERWRAKAEQLEEEIRTVNHLLANEKAYLKEQFTLALKIEKERDLLRKKHREMEQRLASEKVTREHVIERWGKAEHQRDQLITALKQIASEDYRGPRPHSAVIAHNALDNLMHQLDQ